MLGCGGRIVTCQFRGKHVLPRHNGNTAPVKRKAFKVRWDVLRSLIDRIELNPRGVNSGVDARLYG